MNPKIIFLGTEDWSFWLHRLPLARAAKAAGYEVVVAVRVAAHGERIQKEGFRLVPIPWQRSSLNPLREFFILLKIINLYAAERPDIAHHVSAKPILYGSLAARLCGVGSAVNALTGLGFVFISSGLKARLLRPAVCLALKIAFSTPNSRTIFENPDDLSLFVGKGLILPVKAMVIRGSGVDIHKFQPQPESSGTPVVLLACRMLWDKGVGEFVEAAKLLSAEGIPARFVLVGDSDPGNPTAVPTRLLKEWNKDGAIEWWGRRDDMVEVYAQSHIVCLPSYREGLSVALMEAAACGRPLVAADVPGCRDVVRHEETGLLVPAKSGKDLAAALKRLIENKTLRERLGRCARQLAVEEFPQEKVVAQTLEVYRELLSAGSAAA